MKIHKDFIGGNIRVINRKGNDVFLENELRDTTEDWFYWAFCVEGAQAKELTFHFDKLRLGYYGPAVSYDLKEWHWLEQRNGNSFTYKFGENENKVYFAHHILYHPDRFYKFADSFGLKVKELCKSQKKRSVPFAEFGEGSKSIILTARHHACESTGNYVLEGVLHGLIKNPLKDTKVFCVPFVDFDGVIEGDQGKFRTPLDHYMDYDWNSESIYPQTAKIREYAQKNGAHYAFDFHSPWHCGNEHDKVFIVQESPEKMKALNMFGVELEKVINKNSMHYSHKDDYPPFVGWNQGEANFSTNMAKYPENILALTLETTYFGEEDNKVSQEKLVELGLCFADALKNFDNNRTMREAD